MANKKIFSLLTPAAIAAYWKKRAPAEEQTYWGATRFPLQYTPELSISWISGRTGLPVALNPSSFDSEPPLRERFGFEKVTADIPFFREGFHIKEDDAMILSRIANGDYSESFLDPVINRVYHDAYDLLEAGRVQREAMRMQLLCKAGTIELIGAGAKYTLQYPFPAAHKEILTGGARWSDTANSEPHKDIYRWRRNIYMRTGVWPTEIVMSSATFQMMIQSENLINAVRAQKYPGSNANYPVSPEEIWSFVVAHQNDGTTESRQLTYKVAGEMYKPQAKSNSVPYFDDGVVSLLPPGQLGSTWYSDPPESIMNNNGKFSVAMTEGGIVVCQSENDTPPLGIKTWAAMLSAPSFEAVENCGWAQVA